MVAVELEYDDVAGVALEDDRAPDAAVAVEAGHPGEHVGGDAAGAGRVGPHLHHAAAGANIVIVVVVVIIVVVVVVVVISLVLVLLPPSSWPPPAFV